MQNRKLSITLGLLEQVPEDRRESWEQALVTWWANIRPEGGLRLTRHGYDVLHKVLGMESWSVELPEKTHISKQEILDMDRKLCWPYFIRTRGKKNIEIIFFSSREAMMATLYGNVRAWLESCEYRSHVGKNLHATD